MKNEAPTMARTPTDPFALLLEQFRAVMREEFRAWQEEERGRQAPPKAPSGYVKTAEAARYAGGSRAATIREWIRDGKLPQKRYGRHYVVKIADLEALLDEGGRASAAPRTRAGKVDSKAAAMAILANREQRRARGGR